MSFYIKNPTGREIQIVGISGPIGSGKSYLCRKVLAPLGFVPLPMALHMKVKAVVQWSVPIEEAFGSWKSERTRRILQVYGTEICREGIDPDYHIRASEVALYGMYDHGATRFCVPDVRFPDEVEWIHSLGGAIVRLDGRSSVQPGIAGHVSESSYDQVRYDIRLDNTPGQNGEGLVESGVLLNWLYNFYPNLRGA